MEMADLIAITKADGMNSLLAEGAKVLYHNAINLFPPSPSGWRPKVVTCSAKQNTGITELWEIIVEFEKYSREKGYFEELRKQQAIVRMDKTIMEYLHNSFCNDKVVKDARRELEKQLSDGTVTSYTAAHILLDKYFKK